MDPRKMRDAERYQAGKHDLDQHGETVGKVGRRPARRRMNAMVSIRLTPEEERRLRAAADGRGLPLSAFIREVALREIIPATPVARLEGSRTSTVRRTPFVGVGENTTLSSAI
ncbi:MAG: ribbon-helix-helix protein, CopG family [Acidobacteria bacterium]|nr:ribbon-helix-helix protein, CopG family [Acidobacteriota bacterium]